MILKAALDAGTLTVAQQAYLRLQNDLLFAGLTAGQAATTSSAAGNNAHLDITA